MVRLHDILRRPYENERDAGDAIALKHQLGNSVEMRDPSAEADMESGAGYDGLLGRQAATKTERGC